MEIEFRDLKKQYSKYEKDINEAIFGVLKSGEFIGGDPVNELEHNLSSFVEKKHCITCGNGTDALSLVLRAWNIGIGDAVFVPNFTFFATAEVVSLLGATPIFVDVDEDTYNISSTALEKKINEVLFERKLKPKVIITVDLFGLLADYDNITKIATKYSLKILEDAAQAFGATYNGKKACSFGDAATTSFFPAKPLGCYGDGGAIFTDDDQLKSIIESLKVHGKGRDKYDNVRIGVNSRLDTIQAAILNVKFQAFVNHEIDDINAVYEKYISSLNGYVQIPKIPKGFKSTFAQFSIKLKSKRDRDSLKNYLSKFNIPSQVYYKKPLHHQEAFASLKNSDLDYPVSISLSKRILSLPMHPYLNTDEILFISSKIIEFIKKLENIEGE